MPERQRREDRGIEEPRVRDRNTEGVEGEGWQAVSNFLTYDSFSQHTKNHMHVKYFLASNGVVFYLGR